MPRGDKLAKKVLEMEPHIRAEEERLFLGDDMFGSPLKHGDTSCA